MIESTTKLLPKHPYVTVTTGSHLRGYRGLCTKGEALAKSPGLRGIVGGTLSLKENP